jgi:hypothetical protein
VSFYFPNMIWHIPRVAKPVTVLGVLLISVVVSPRSIAQRVPLDSIQGLQPHDVEVRAVVYQGRKAVQVMPSADADSAWAAHPSGTGGGIVILPKIMFHNGSIELQVAGKPRAGAPGEARGFVGVAFHLNADASKYECAYLRPTNGRAEDQVRRNHSTQYSSYPDYDWLRLRTESPGKYESYVDLVPGEWTKIRIEVGTFNMRLYVNGASQPTLVVNDMKLGDTQGGVALWIGVGTEAYFVNLRVAERIR